MECGATEYGATEYRATEWSRLVDAVSTHNAHVIFKLERELLH